MASISATGCEKYISMLRYGQYGQVGADGVWREKESANGKLQKQPKSAEDVQKSAEDMLRDAEDVTESAEVIMCEGKQVVIYEYVVKNKVITTAKACELLGVKERRAISILADMCKNGYLKIQGATSNLKYILNKE